MPDPESIPYDRYVHDALREVVARVLREMVDRGLPGEHHFYVTFRTDAPGVSISPSLRAQYPETMTIVLQHRYDDPTADDRAFGVTLHFGGRAERLTIPFSAITAFVDPHVKFGVQLPYDEGPKRPVVDERPSPVRPEPERPPTSTEGNVVKVDFGKRK